MTCAVTLPDAAWDVRGWDHEKLAQEIERWQELQALTVTENKN
jgi:hypothetical protein